VYLSGARINISQSIMLTRPLVLSQVLGATFAAISLFAFQWMNSAPGGWLIPVFAVVTAITLAVAWQKSDAVRVLLARIQRVMPSRPGLAWLLGTVALGLTVRLVVAAAFPAKLVSDSEQYLDLAHSLAQGLDYSAPEGRAYWPPGLPLATAPLLLLFGSAAPLIYNLITFMLAVIATFALGLKLANRQVAGLSALFVAIWPNFVFATPLLNKECLLIVLWPTAVFLYLLASENASNRKACIYALAAGASIGYAALTQPSGALLGGCFALFSLLTIGWRRRTGVCLLAAACGAVAVVTPWTIRNYEVFHAFVPIATEGGVNFYMVTQPESDGRWTENYESEEATSRLSSDELARNEHGFILGIKSIQDHPIHFWSTIMRKPFYLFGKDVNNSYWIFERGGVGTAREYAVAYWVSNGFYLIIILLITSFALRKTYTADTSPALILPWMFVLYPIFAHSLFETAERHRYAIMPLTAIFAAMAICFPGSDRNDWTRR